MHPFFPSTVIFEPTALQYELGEKIYRYFQNQPVEIIKTSLSQFTKKLSDLSEKQRYARSKTVLAVTRNKQKKLEMCKPSADYRFALISNCPGSCEYCYLQTNQSYKPYLKVYVNLGEIFETVLEHIEKVEKPYVTFEVSSNGDPLAIEHITGSVGTAIEYFASLAKGRLRIVTKYNNVDYVTGRVHHGHTRFRLSMNTEYVIRKYEHGTGTFAERLEAAVKLAEANYPLGFIVAPIFIYKNWRQDYTSMFQSLYERLKKTPISDLTFEFIQHRYTASAKQRILERFPNTGLDMSEENRRLKWGKFGRYKYIYQKDDEEMIREHMYQLTKTYFPDARVEYFT